MIGASELNKAWERTLRAHSLTPMLGDSGEEFRPIGDRSLVFLEAMWGKRKKPIPDIGEMIEEGKDVRFWSDPHFEHDNIRKLASRFEFSSVQEMDDTIWANVAAAMAEADLVVCLGDFSLRNALGWQRRFVTTYGNKHFAIIGNHDIKGASPESWLATGAAASFAFSLPRDLIHG